MNSNFEKFGEKNEVRRNAQLSQRKWCRRNDLVMIGEFWLQSLVYFAVTYFDVKRGLFRRRAFSWKIVKIFSLI